VGDQMDITVKKEDGNDGEWVKQAQA